MLKKLVEEMGLAGRPMVYPTEAHLKELSVLYFEGNQVETDWGTESEYLTR